MTRIRTIMSYLFCIMILSSTITSIASAETIDRIVAIVNDNIITLSELNAAVVASVSEQKHKGDIFQLQIEILNGLIEKRLMEQAATRAGVLISEKELDNAIEDIKRQNNLNQDQLIMNLDNMGLTYKGYREQIRIQIKEAKFIAREFRRKVTISSEDVEDYYYQILERYYNPEKFRLRVIGIFSDDDKAALEKAAMILEELRNGKPFIDLAMLYSDGPNASEGGDLGYLRLGEAAESIEEAAKGLAIGEFSEIIKTETGLYIIKLEDRKVKEAQPLVDVQAEVKELLFKKLVGERYKVWLEDMKRRSHIDIRL